MLSHCTRDVKHGNDTRIIFMAKHVCMVVGCAEHATQHAELVTIEITPDNMELWTDVNVCQRCESLLEDYFEDKFVTFEGFAVDHVSVMHDPPNSEGYAKPIAVWFIPAEADDVDEFDGLNIGLFDKEPLNLDGALVDVEVY